MHMCRHAFFLLLLVMFIKRVFFSKKHFSNVLYCDIMHSKITREFSYV